MYLSYGITMDLLSSLIWNSLSASSELYVYLISSGNASMNFFTYFIIDTFIDPF